ncbi:MAG: phosphohydrolase [Candidatus Kerfeldbacteria bacterium CG_4_10_14_0_8_um_filter_42_10]|uniref:Phosphohydrolase n=1 Tax=Candidatus Kerfeldbacteria bacterium CG_4_10_14_0_8_um_filter_42_10 TaxID=2014248 RepID=A0A2M7RKU4_9BACT|nr:MAG: phosphohydrolase [Candidatus Kerfeldbacteria bacterium CG_4_10_14_0_8_um_filter_42_10]
MNRADALAFLREKVKNQNLFKHSLAVEAVMRRLARNFKEDEEKWALAGLLHDIDYEETKDNPEVHSLRGAAMLIEKELEPEIIDAVKAHNEIHGIPRKTKIAQALYCTDPLTGLIVAATLVLPDKKIANLSVDNILNRFKENSFAKGANRKVISACQELNLNLEKFAEIGLEAMQSINKEIGL